MVSSMRLDILSPRPKGLQCRVNVCLGFCFVVLGSQQSALLITSDFVHVEQQLAQASRVRVLGSAHGGGHGIDDVHKPTMSPSSLIACQTNQMPSVKQVRKQLWKQLWPEARSLSAVRSCGFVGQRVGIHVPPHATAFSTADPIPCEFALLDQLRYIEARQLKPCCGDTR